MTDLAKLKKLPLVSVGVPTYNHPELLRRCLDCLCRQTYQNLEVVVSDNCSPGDAVIAVIGEYSASALQLRFFRQPDNIGPTRNFDFVRQESHGKYFMWLADDDLISDNFIVEAVIFLESEPEYVMASGLPFWMKGGIEICGRLPILHLDGVSRRERIFSYITGVEDNCVFYSLFRKNIIDAVFPLPQYPGNDWLMIIRLLYQGKSKVLHTTKIYKNAGGISQNIRDFSVNFNCREFWIRHRSLTLVRHLLPDVLCREYYARSFADRLVYVLFFLFACCLRGGHDLLVLSLYRGFIKRYMFHLLYLILPRRIFTALKSLKSRAISAVSKMRKKHNC